MVIIISQGTRSLSNAEYRVSSIVVSVSIASPGDSAYGVLQRNPVKTFGSLFQNVVNILLIVSYPNGGSPLVRRSANPKVR